MSDADLTAERQLLLTMEKQCLTLALKIVNDGIASGILKIARDGTVFVRSVFATCGSRDGAPSRRCRNRPVPHGQVE
jgi:hypothetical protein